MALDPQGCEIVAAGGTHHHDELAVADLYTGAEGRRRGEVRREVSQVPVDLALDSGHTSKLHDEIVIGCCCNNASANRFDDPRNDAACSGNRAEGGRLIPPAGCLPQPLSSVCIGRALRSSRRNFAQVTGRVAGGSAVPGVQADSVYPHLRLRPRKGPLACDGGPFRSFRPLSSYAAQSPRKVPRAELPEASGSASTPAGSPPVAVERAAVRGAPAGS